MNDIHGSTTIGLPDYKPAQPVTGTLRAWGDHAFEKLWHLWTAAFAEYHPRTEFTHFLRGTSTAVGALYTGTADIGLFGREIRKLERTSWKRVFDHQPQGFTVATGAFDVFAKTVAVAILVNAGNPLNQIDFAQLDAIYSADRRRGRVEPITRWGQLGLSGEWARKPVHAYGLDPDTGTAQHVRTRVLLEGAWSANATLPPGAPTEMYAGSGGHAADALVKALSTDPYAIGIAGFRNVGPEVKALGVSEDGVHFFRGNRETTRTREYPLSRSVYAFVREAPGTTWNPIVREFMRFVLSRQGQQAVDREGEYLPLPPSIVDAELTRLEDMSSGT
jgi:phosphate transport system substrate-binding protein